MGPIRNKIFERSSLCFLIGGFLLCVSSGLGSPLNDPPLSRLECIQDLSDFVSNDWMYISSANMSYAQTSADLPAPFQNELDGEGIFYYKYKSLGYYNQIIKSLEKFNGIRPIFLYVKYYNHIPKNSNDQPNATLAHPSLTSPSKYEILPPTNDFIWGEALVPIDPDMLTPSSKIGVAGYFFDPADHFFVDDIIVTQGYLIDNMDQIKDLCESPGEETTTVTPPISETTENSEGTTMAPPEFKCGATGTFPDPRECSVYHVCTLNAVGDLMDHIFTCPSATVFCEETSRCEFPDVCPCTNH